LWPEKTIFLTYGPVSVKVCREENGQESEVLGWQGKASMALRAAWKVRKVKKGGEAEKKRERRKKWGERVEKVMDRRGKRGRGEENVGEERKGRESREKLGKVRKREKMGE
jgi:hypothetical protein